MTKQKKNEMIENLKHCYNTVIQQYETGKHTTGYIKDAMWARILEINKQNKETDIMKTFTNAIKHVSQLQSDLAIHNLRKQGLI